MMPTETERITRLESDVGQMKIDIAVAQTDIQSVKNKLDGGAIVLAILKTTFGGSLF